MKMRHFGPATVVVVAMAIVNCTDGVTGVSDGVVRVVATGQGLTIQNRSDAPIHYFVVEAQTTALIDWLPCAGPTCPAIAAGTTLDIPHTQVVGWTPAAREALVYWWRSIPTETAGGGFRADSLRTLRTRL